jgi:hypothetical protein
MARSCVCLRSYDNRQMGTNGFAEDKRVHILSQLRITLWMIWLVENAAAKLEALTPVITAFVPG